MDASNVPPGLDGNDDNIMGGLAGNGPVIPNAAPVIGGMPQPEVNQNLGGRRSKRKKNQRSHRLFSAFDYF